MRWNERRHAVAAIMGFALLVGLAGCGSGAHGPAGSGKGATSGATPYVTITTAPTATRDTSPGAWQTLSGCANAPDAIRVRYDASVVEQKGGPTQVSLRRSDNCGGTWTNLNPPAITGVDYATNVDTMVVFASPLNTQTAFLMVQAEPSQGCAVTSARICQPQFVTTNGGVTWKPLTLPAPGILEIASNTGSTQGVLVHAQGSRVYARVTDTVIGSSGVVPPGRLVASDDGGLTWRVADAPLAAQGLGIWDYAVAPSGLALFAAAEPFNDPASQAPNYGATLSMWASPDGGATWKQAAYPPGDTTQAPIVGMCAGVTPGGNPVVYAAVANQTSISVFGSPDDGGAWQSDSHLTIPIGATSNAPTFVGALPDGSVIAVYTTGPTMAWLPGTTARIVAGPVNLDLLKTSVIQQRGGVAYLWLMGSAPNASTIDPTTVYTQLNL